MNDVLTVEYLKPVAERYAPSYGNAEPFPHAVIDDFLPSDLLDGILGELPSPRSDRERNNVMTRKKIDYGAKSLHQLGPRLAGLIQGMNSPDFLEFLEGLTGISGLIPDPYMMGGGLHQIRRGGFLKIHADFNWHERLHLDRRVNLLLYLNKDWRSDFGGDLELWDNKMTSCRKRISPIANRLVVFNTTDNSYHGHPEPLNCPEDRSRYSIALYFYTNGRPTSERRFGKNTLTLYRERPNENLYENPLRQRIKYMIPAWLYNIRSRLKGG